MPDASVIKEMFEDVAPRYDFLNRVLSLGIDRGWRRRVVESLELRPEHRVLDLCCGTGDLALEIARESSCTACDFTWNMLTRAREKSASAGQPLALACADTLELPFGDELFDRATIERMRGHYLRILTSLVESRERRLREPSATPSQILHGASRASRQWMHHRKEEGRCVEGSRSP